MKNNEKINSFSLSTLVIALSGAPFWGILTSYMIHISKTASLISMLIGFVLSLILSLIFLKFFDSYPELLGSEKIKKVFGKFSYPLNTCFGVLATIIYIFFTYRLATFLSSQYLTQTSNIYIYAMIIFITAYTASKKIETVTRVSVISFFLAISIFAFDFFNLVNAVKIDNFLPFITVNTKSIIASSISFTLYYTVPTFFVMSYKKNNLTDKDIFKKYFYFMFSLSFIILFLAISVTIGVYGINLTDLFDYPLYTVLKKIQIFSFLESLENISSIIWILYTINAGSIMLCTTFDNLESAFNLSNKKSRILNLIIILIAFIFPLIFYQNNNYIETYGYVKFPLIVTLILLILITISTLFISIKYKKNKEN